MELHDQPENQRVECQVVLDAGLSNMNRTRPACKPRLAVAAGSAGQARRDSKERARHQRDATGVAAPTPCPGGSGSPRGNTAQWCGQMRAAAAPGRGRCPPPRRPGVFRGCVCAMKPGQYLLTGSQNLLLSRNETFMPLPKPMVSIAFSRSGVPPALRTCHSLLSRKRGLDLLHALQIGSDTSWISAISLGQLMRSGRPPMPRPGLT